MNLATFAPLLQKSFADNGLVPPNEMQTEQFHRLTLHLMEVNEHTNLTAIRDIPSIIAKHYVDSCIAAKHVPQGATVLDIGCGAGFPTLPLAIYRPDLRITALDSTEKKVAFVAESASLLGCTNVTTLSGRAEDRRLIQKIAPFDIVTSRAVSRLRILCEISVPYLKIGGKMVALKGAEGETELNEALGCIATLKCELESVQKASLQLLDGTKEARTILCIQKSQTTPPQYPRAYAAIKKSPL